MEPEGVIFMDGVRESVLYTKKIRPRPHTKRQRRFRGTHPEYNQSESLCQSFQLNKLSMYYFNRNNLENLEKSLSLERFAEYLSKTDGNREEAMRLYAWNTAVSAAFYAPLQALEITLRSRINAVLAEKYGAEWFDSSDIDFHLEHSERIEEARERSARGRQEPSTPSGIVASLSFGFWVFLLSEHYEKLWRNTLHQILPHQVSSHTFSRKEVRKPLEKMRNLRNCIAHHDPIFHMRLENHYQIILETIGWMSPDKKAWVEAHSRVEEILAQSQTDPGVRF